MMRTLDPWIGDLYRDEGYCGIRLLILGESHYLGVPCNNPSEYTCDVIRGAALKQSSFSFFTRIQRLFANGRGGFTPKEKTDFWHRVSFYNFIQTMLEKRGCRPTPEMWRAAGAPFLQTIEELEPQFILVVGTELYRNLPRIPEEISVCSIQHPCSPGFRYERWQPKVLSAFAAAVKAHSTF